MIAVIKIFAIGWMRDTFAKSQVATLPSSYTYFAFYPSDLAAINMDRSGTTRIGKYLLNHSFMIPGWIGVIVSTIVAYGLAQVYF